MGKKKNKVIFPPDLPPELADDEIEVSDEDYDFVESNREYAGFLTRLDTKSINRHVSRVANHKEDELEALYEKRRQKASFLKTKEEETKIQVDPVDALPIKTLCGELKYRTVNESKAGNIPNENELVSGIVGNDADAGVVKLTKVEKRQKLKKTRKEAKKLGKDEPSLEVVKEELHQEVLAKVEEDISAEELYKKKKIKLAEVGMQLIENPEANIKALKELLEISDDKDPNIVKLGLMSLLAVFKDIIPGYRIRLPTEKELEMTVSKLVRQTRVYEYTLLNSYKVYLVKLKALEKKPSFRQIVVRCLCSLLEAVPHFNFRETLIASVVKNIRSTDDAIRKLCCEAIKSLFLNEGKHGGEATLEAVRLIANQVKYHDCQLHPDTIEVFLYLRFDEGIGKSNSNDDKAAKPKRRAGYKNQNDSRQVQGNDKKRNKHEMVAKKRDEVTAEFKSVSFAPDSKERRRMQSETLSSVFETYFRILKHSTDPSVPRLKGNDALSSVSNPLLAPCLNGLGKFSHLIDLDFMGDLMKSLKKLAGHGDSYDDQASQNQLSVSERLQCCIVAFKVMRNNLDALNVDLQDFFVQLYNLLLEYRPGRDRGEVLAEALKIMLCEGKQHDIQRAAAFIKRLSSFSLVFGSADAMAALVTIKHLLQKNSKCHIMLENDAGGGSFCGLVPKYQPHASDPNLSGALASVLWDLSLLLKHYDASISSMSQSILSMANADPSHSLVYLSMSSPDQAFADFSIERKLPKLTGMPPSALNRKRKRGKEKNSILLNPNQDHQTENTIDEEEVKRKLEGHFTTQKDIMENERLRRELNHTSLSLNLCKQYKRQKQKL